MIDNKLEAERLRDAIRNPNKEYFQTVKVARINLIRRVHVLEERVRMLESRVNAFERLRK